MNRVVMITGSTRGIGFATASEFLKNGDRVVTFCRHKVHAEQAKKGLLSFGPPENILALSGDVRSEKDVKKIVSLCLKHFVGIDVLINNAGIAAYKSVEETGEREWDDIIDTNLKGTFLFIRQVLPVMKKQGKGVIINVSSALGVEAEGYFSAYCASKFGVVGLTRAVADETRGDGLRVYAILPWAVNTTLLFGSDLELDPSEVLAPEYVARRIFEAARGRKKSGSLIEVYL
jgi:NAD(P)-dependent dehydrogenase (short-subunit alcohol dehydrogenase family)